MRQSQLFTKTRKEAPKDETSKNAQLLIKAGFIYKEMAGVYAYLPLGYRVLNKIIEIIREEMNSIGGQELLLTALQKKEVWDRSGRWDDNVIDIWFKTALQNGTEVGLGNTHEEPLTYLMTDFVASYRDLPFSAYQFQTKFRNETRAKSGIMRTREFIMKDLYSFSRSIDEHNEFYEKAEKAYIRIFDRAGIGHITFKTFASGGSFAKYSHEFQTLTDAGEDKIYYDADKKLAVNQEVYNEAVLSDLKLDKDKLVEAKAVEVGNIFSLGTKFSDAMDLVYKDENGDVQKVVMGCYGIGPGRLMGTIVEALSDENGIIWPVSVAPFRVHLISVGDSEAVVSAAQSAYDELTKQGVEVLWDDRDARPGQKFADSDLIGIPTRFVISEKTIEEGVVEVKDRKTGEVEKITLDKAIKAL